MTSQTTTTRRLARLIPATVAVLSLIGLATVSPVAGSTGQSLHDSCPDLTGDWVSGPYEALAVTADGGHEEIADLAMTLRISEQHGCHFVALNEWGNDSIGGTEHMGGVLNPIGDWITILEVGDHPTGGTSGRVLGRLVDDHQIHWEYAAYSGDGAQVNVFSTVLTRIGEPTAREACPDLLGTWRSPEYDVLEVHADGSTTELQGTVTSILEIVHQDRCHFRGVNSWSNGERRGSEQVAGVLHADGELITMLEVGDIPDGGTRGSVRGRLTDGETLSWDYVGLSLDSSKGQAFGVNLTREADAEPPAREACPDLTGTWSASEWEGLAVDDQGAHEIIGHEFKQIAIDEQFGCRIKGTFDYVTSSDGTGRTEHVIGVVNAEDQLLTMRVVAPHPLDGFSATITGRIEDDRRLITEYTGVNETGSAAFVYLLDLARE